MWARVKGNATEKELQSTVTYDTSFTLASTFLGILHCIFLFSLKVQYLSGEAEIITRRLIVFAPHAEDLAHTAPAHTRQLTTIYNYNTEGFL